MKKLLPTLISAALIAMPLAVISTPAAAKTTPQVTAQAKGSDAKANPIVKTKAKTAKKKKTKKSA